MVRIQMPRWFTVLSLLACVAAAVGWVGSFAATRGLAWDRGFWHVGISSDAGGVAVGFCRAARANGAPADAAADPLPVYWDWPAVTPGGVIGKVGFGWGDVAVHRRVPVLSGIALLGRLFQVPMSGHYVRVPWWFLLALGAAAPVAGWVSRRRRSRAGSRGRCRECGYDLRATPERCPECGATPGPLAEAGFFPTPP